MPYFVHPVNQHLVRYYPPPFMWLASPASPEYQLVNPVARVRLHQLLLSMIKQTASHGPLTAISFAALQMIYK